MDLTTILDTLKKIDWAVSLLASIPLSILANVLTPTYQSWRARKSVEKRKTRATDLQSELANVRRLKNDPAALAIENNIAIFQALSLLGIGSALASFPIIEVLTGPIAALFFTMSVMSAQRQYKLLRRCQSFEEYEKAINDQVAALNAA